MKLAAQLFVSVFAQVAFFLWSCQVAIAAFVYFISKGIAVKHALIGLFVFLFVCFFLFFFSVLLFLVCRLSEKQKVEHLNI